jgi:hypothetical protein
MFDEVHREEMFFHLRALILRDFLRSTWPIIVTTGARGGNSDQESGVGRGRRDGIWETASTTSRPNSCAMIVASSAFRIKSESMFVNPCFFNAFANRSGC